MNFLIISKYINKLAKDDINKFALSQNIKLTNDELNIIYNHIKNDYQTFLTKDPNIILNQVKTEVRAEVYNKIIELYNQYKDTNTIDDSQEGLQKVLENYLKTEVVKEEGESYIIKEMNQKGRRIYEVTYDYYVGEAEPTQGTLTVTFEKDGAGNYIVGNCEF